MNTDSRWLYIQGAVCYLSIKSINSKTKSERNELESRSNPRPSSLDEVGRMSADV